MSEHKVIARILRLSLGGRIWVNVIEWDGARWEPKTTVHGILFFKKRSVSGIVDGLEILDLLLPYFEDNKNLHHLFL